MQRQALVARIEQLGLAHDDRPTRTITLHRFVQATYREQQPARAAAATAALAFKALAAANPGDPERGGNWPAYHALWLHLASPGLFDSTLPEARQLIIDLVRYRYKLGDFHGAHRQAAEVLDHWSAFGHDPDPLTLELRRNQANALRRMGDPKAAYQLDKAVAADLRGMLGPNHLRTLIAESGLAADLRALDKYAEALALDLHTVRGAQQPGIGEDHEWALMFASNLATSHRILGEPAKAAEIDKHTYERRLRVLGPDHPYTAFSAGSYGRDLRDLGDFEQSRIWLETAHQAYKRILLDANHPDTMRAAKNLAVTLRRLARFEEAHRLSLETWQKVNARLGPEHPDSLLCLMAVATTYSGLELHDRARRAGSNAVAKLKTVLGRDHFYTLVARNNLAAIRLKEKRPVPQVREMEQVVEALRDKLEHNERHWILSITAMNLANHRAEAGDVGDALFLDEDTRDRLEAEFGPDHPDTISASINLAIS
jgi:tetratricopeptide (TPR) repeat protein